MAARNKHKWDKIRNEFFATDMNLAELAAKHGLSRAYLNNVAAKEKWYKQRDEMANTARQRLMQEIAKDLVDKNEAGHFEAPLTTDEHLDRSMRTGDQLYLVFEAAVKAAKSFDLPKLKQAVSTWVELDNQHRKIRGIEHSTDKPLVNVNVMAALPKPSDLVKAAEASAVDVESRREPADDESSEVEPAQATQ
tara:strand:- start:1201 stop:1779 length:579 start_codon:yes stop_codon:yes gene_type:complete